MKNSEILLVKELEKSIEQKISLLKCLNTAYSCSLDLLDNKSYDAFLEKLDVQQKLLNEIDNIDSQITVTADKYESYKNEILAFINGYKGDSNLPVMLQKFIEDITTSRKLLKSCKVLNEKLTYRINEVQNEIKQNMLTFKNRRLIKTGYSNVNTVKTGLVIDYKNN
ncbi:MAG: hypothetical protein A2Y17_04420 [Clostridiales bacterium GWF2_38_85]|nr:MAG: hypothetical protein A2Y17_04420 [Clostridiales bacterium GWF2_38_85]HBL83403.1 hypothetical protein [Clostridiales bacterium]